VKNHSEKEKEWFGFRCPRELMYMSEKEKEVQKRYQQEQTRYKKQVEKLNKIQKKKVA
jgi:hypothetical protein